jgi:hypothetical protein
MFVTGFSISFSVWDDTENAGIISLFCPVCFRRVMACKEGFQSVRPWGGVSPRTDDEECTPCYLRDGFFQIALMFQKNSVHGRLN